MARRRALLLGCAVQVSLAAPVLARPIHGSLGGGSTLVWRGDGGDRFRLDVAADLKWHSRYGGLVAWRAFDEDHAGLLTAGLVFEGGAARPRLVVDLILEAGADLDQQAPIVGGGVRSTLTIIGPLGVALQAGAYLVIDGLEDSRLQLQSNALVVARW